MNNKQGNLVAAGDQSSAYRTSRYLFVHKLVIVLRHVLWPEYLCSPQIHRLNL